MPYRVFAFGGGVQSTAALVLASQGRINFREFVFAQVGQDSEYPGTLTYLEEHAKPFAAAHNLTIHEVAKTWRGDPDTLLVSLLRNTRSVDIPMRDAGGGPGRRGCTGTFKIKPISQFLKTRGATADDPAAVGMGISVDEAHRMRKDSGFAWETLEYPLIFPHRFTRNDCRQIILDAGLPLPPKSACWWCPFHTVTDWKRLRRTDPDLFDRAADLEQTLSRRSVEIGRVPVFLTRYGKPLPMAVPDGGQTSYLDDDGDVTDTCETGHCMT